MQSGTVEWCTFSGALRFRVPYTQFLSTFVSVINWQCDWLAGKKQWIEFYFCMWVDIWEIVLSFEFHENWLRGFRDTGVWKLHYLAGHLYHSLCCQDRIYRTGRNAFLICPVWGPIASDSLAFVTCHPHYNQKCTGPALQPVMCVPTLVGGQNRITNRFLFSPQIYSAFANHTSRLSKEFCRNLSTTFLSDHVHKQTHEGEKITSLTAVILIGNFKGSVS